MYLPDGDNLFGAGNTREATDSVMYQSIRRGENTLILSDFKVSKADMQALPAGNLG